MDKSSVYALFSRYHVGLWLRAPGHLAFIGLYQSPPTVGQALQGHAPGGFDSDCICPFAKSLSTETIEHRGDSLVERVGPGKQAYHHDALLRKTIKKTRVRQNIVLVQK